jgi:hypothetical protein
MSKENNMDPGVVPPCGSELTQMEEMVISKAHCHMIMKRYRGHQHHYTGHCVCFWQSTVNFRTVLPVLPEDTDVILLRPVKADLAEDRYRRQFRRELRVRRRHVETALQWLKANHPDYRDIIISTENLSQLPADGDISSSLTTVEEADNEESAEDLLRRGDSRAVAEDIERGVDGEELRPSAVSMVPNLEVQDTEVELL